MIIYEEKIEKSSRILKDKYRKYWYIHKGQHFIILRKETKKQKQKLLKLCKKKETKLSTSNTLRRYRSFPKNSELVSPPSLTFHKVCYREKRKNKILKQSIQGFISLVPNLFF